MSEVAKTETKLTLYGKLAQVMGLVERVPKTGHNKFHGYDYATEADITSAVRSAMAARALVMVPNVLKSEWAEVLTASNKKERLCTLTVRFDVHDGESGESLSFEMLGQGQDSGDKATYKAMTGATKYALLKLFLIPTGDDPENEDSPASKAPPPPAGVAALKARVAPRASPPAGPPEPPPHGDSEAPPQGGAPTHDRNAFFAFGKSKGVAVGQMDDDSLSFYRGAFKRDLADESKKQWHEKTRRQLAAVEGELQARGLPL